MDKAELKKDVEKLLQRTNISDDEPFIRYGGDSLFFSKLQVEIKKKYKKKIPIKDIFINSTVNKLHALLDDNNKVELSDIQKAYILGRNEDVALGGYGSHAFFAFEVDKMDMDTACENMKKVIAHQDMLRAVLLPDGSMEIGSGENISIEKKDLTAAPSDEKEKAIADEFNTLFHKPGMLNVCIIQDEKEHILIGIAHDGLIADGESHGIIMNDFAIFASGKQPDPHPSYNEYVSCIAGKKMLPEYNETLSQTIDKLKEVDGNPLLPMKARSRDISFPNVVVSERKIEKTIYEKAVWEAAQRGVTGFSLMATIYGKAIGKYADNKKFLMNFPVSQRPDELDGIHELVGLCSNFMVMDFDNTCDCGIWDQTEKFQEKLFEQRELGELLQGTDVLKGLKQQKRLEELASVVFTSTLASSAVCEYKKIKTKTYTSQVWLEGLLTESEDEVLFTLSYPEELFESYVAEGIADCFKETIDAIANYPNAFDTKSDIDISSKDKMAIAGRTANVSYSQKLTEHALAHPDKVAVVSNEKSYTFESLISLGKKAGSAIRQSNVAVWMAKSADAIAMEIALAYAGIAVLPLDHDMPKEAVIDCLQKIGIKTLLIDDNEDISDLPDDFTIICPEDIKKASEKSFKGRNNPVFAMIQTSGTTGTMKTVALKRDAVLDCFVASKERFGIDEKDVVLQLTNCSHDMSLFDIFGMSYLGGTIVVVDQKDIKNPEVWVQLITDHKVTVWNSVPAFFEMLLLAEKSVYSKALKQLRVIIQGGDYLQLSVAEEVLKQNKKCRLFNVGGPTETTIWNICHEVTEDDIKAGRIPYGRAFGNAEYHILDEHMNPCPIGKVGMMYISGPGVADGYLGYTEDACKFTEYHGVKTYMSGDLGMYLPNGEILFSGRKDRQVKINGKRIELDGIETCLNGIDGIDRGVAVVKDKVLFAFYCSAKSLTEEDVRNELKNKIPKYMVPAKIQRLSELPITKNGKVDRRSLLEQPLSNGLSEIDHTENNSAQSDSTQNDPTSEASETALKIREIFKEILFEDDIDLDEDFYEMGGDSVSAMRIIAKIRESMGVKIAPSELFEHSTIRSLAECISPTKEDVSVKKKINSDSFALTPIQRAYIVGRAAEDNKVSSHFYMEFKAESYDVSKLEAAWNKLIESCPALRIVIDDKTGTQKVLEQAQHYSIPYTKFDSAEAFMQFRNAMEQHVIPVDKWPVFELAVSKVDDHEVLHVGLDNSIIDGLSICNVIDSLSRMYSGEELEIKEQSSFESYVREQEEKRDSEEYREEVSEWKEYLKQIPAMPEIPTVSTDGEKSFHRKHFVIKSDVWAAIKDNIHKHRLSDSSVLLACYGEALYPWVRKKEYTINVTLNRKALLDSGYINTLGEFTDIALIPFSYESAESFKDKCRNVQKSIYLNMNRSALDGVEVQRMWTVEHNGTFGRAFPVVFTSMLGTQDGWKMPGVYDYGLTQTPQVWLDCQVFLQGDDLYVNWDIRDGIFDDEILDAAFEAFRQLINSLADTEFWNSEEVNHTVVKNPAFTEEVSDKKLITDKSFYEQFKSSLKKNPESIAVIFENKEYTYSELNEMVNKLAEEISPANRVGIHLPKGVRQIVAVLAASKIGATYVPLDIHNPKDRLAKITGQAELDVIVSESGVERISTSKNEDLGENKNPAYIIFTSGSTGMPKGVVIAQSAANNTIADINKRYKVTGTDRMFALSNLSFDLSVYDMFGSFRAGAGIVMPDENSVKDPKAWIPLVGKSKVTVWNSVPAFMEMLCTYLEMNNDADKKSLSSIRLILLSGDKISNDLPARIHKFIPKAKIVCLGGATEAAIWSNYFEPDEICEQWPSIPYGYALTNQQYYILDSNLRICPSGVEGELCIAGAGLADGYLGDEKLTEEKFVYVPRLEKRVYRTGDRGKMVDGCIWFLGREDTQIKRRGFRIELGEIENALKSVDAVEHAKVSYKNGKLVSFVNSNNEEIFKDEILSELKNKVPEYYLPDDIWIVQKMPLNSSGKIDSHALWKIYEKEAVSQKAEEFALTKTETTIRDIWRKVLGDDSINDAETDFFMRGGDSIRAIAAVSSINNAYPGMEVEIKDIFYHGTIRAFAAFLDEKIEKEESFEEGVI